MAPAGRDVGHAAVRHEAGREPGDGGHDHPAPAAAPEGDHERSGDGGDARGDGCQRSPSRTRLRRRDGTALCGDRARPPGVAGRDRRRPFGQPVAARLDRGRARGGVPGAEDDRRRRRSAGDGNGALRRVRDHRCGTGRGRARLHRRRPHAAGADARRVGPRGGARLSGVHGRPRGSGGEPGRRSRRLGAAPDRRGCGCAHRARDARQVAARRTGCGPLCRGPGGA